MIRTVWIQAVMLMIVGCLCAENLAPNGNFEEGTDGPAGWRLVGGKGQLESKGHTDRGISVTGTEKDNPFWAADAEAIEAGKAYRFSFWVRSEGSGGCVISGPDFVNRDYRPGEEWMLCSYVFAARKDPRGGILRLGQWQRNGTTWFDAVELNEVKPIHQQFEEIELGEGESIRGGVYTFDPDFGYEGSNVSRPLAEFTCGFNSNRWTVGPGQWLVYHHRMGDIEQVDPTVRVNVGYYSSGRCIVECSGDGKDWKELGRIGKVETKSFSLPKEMSGQKEAWIRIRGSAANDPQGPGSFQIYSYTYSAQSNRPLPDVIGRTHFVAILEDNKELIQADLLSCGSMLPDNNQIVRFRVKNISSEKQVVSGSTEFPSEYSLYPEEHFNSLIESPKITLLPNEETIVQVRYDLRRAGASFLQAEVLVHEEGYHGQTVYSARMELSIPALHDAVYGYPGASFGPLCWWWCEGTYKVSRQRPAARVDIRSPMGVIPQSPSVSPSVRACRSEYEPVQIVLRPAEPLKQVMVSVEGNASIPASAIKAHRVAYHYVHRTSDPTGCTGWWPDALPKWDEPVDLAANENQPIWVLVKIPHDCPAKTSTIKLHIQPANLIATTIPIDIRVFDFEMPQRSHVESGFGISPGNIRRYHNLQTKEEERAVWNLYMQSFREHRIAPYNFAPYDPMRVTWKKGPVAVSSAEPETLTAEMDFAAWDKQAEKYLNGNNGFSSFMLPLQGTGGGTFESRSPGKIGPFEQGTDGYRKAFASYCGAIQQHLQDKGWLGREYIYWFDEPEPKDYDFVRAGMDEIRRAGPQLRRMLTEEPIEPLFGSVDLWCPILDQFNPESCQSRQKQGETIWWYVCTGPKAPYPGLFIDHSAIDLRMWLWMTWKWKAQGILVWESTYWTSGAAFPEPKIQNPWTDPMGYVSGYSNPAGFVGYWGNGDGRFLYPPNRDVANDKSKHLSGPVSSIRWEMLREGLEDYEYFWLLREAIAKAEKAGMTQDKLDAARKLLEVGPDIVADKTHFTADPKPMYKQREAIANTIETLR